MGQANHPRGAVGWIKKYVQDIQMVRISQCLGQALSKFFLRADNDTDPASDQVADSLIVPVMNIVEGTFQNFPLRGIATIVQHEPVI